MLMYEEIVKENAGLIWTIAKKFYGIPKSDLYQAGVLGIIKAYNNYKCDGDCKFSTYAYKYIYGEMYMVASNKSIKVSKDIIKLNKLIEKGRCMMAQELMRDPSNEELAEFLGIDLNTLNNAIEYTNSLVSIDEESDERSLHEVLYKEEDVTVDDKILLQDSIDSLDTLEQDIIKARYYEDLTQSETARKLGITQVMVSRYESKSLKKMRDFMYM